MAPGSFMAGLAAVGSAAMILPTPFGRPVHRLPPPTTTPTAAGWWARASNGLSRPIGRRKSSIIILDWTTGHLPFLLGLHSSPATLSPRATATLMVKVGINYLFNWSGYRY